MGIFDDYLKDMQKEIRRVTDGVGKIQDDAKRVVGAIDELEEKVTHLPTEKQIKKKLKKKVNNAAKKISDTNKPTKNKQ